MKKLLLAAFSFCIISIVFQSCKKDPAVSPKTINIEGIFSITGNWSSLGVTSKAALELAVEDINTYLTSKNASFRLESSVSDTKLDPELAKTLFTSAKNKKVPFLIGPQSSAELAAIKPLSDAAEVIVISQSSTAGSLAIQDDAIFRFCPSDKVEGAAIASSIYKAGLKGLVTIARNDAGNIGLQTATGAAFTSEGGQVIAIDPYDTEDADYSSVVASIKAELNTLIDLYGVDKVGVYLASFDEGIEVFKLAATDNILSSVKWFGGDGVVQSTAFLEDASVAGFAIKTDFFAPAFGLPVANEDKWKPIAARIKASTKIEPDAFALVAYDAIWTIAYTLESLNGNIEDFSLLKAKFVEQANKNSGIVGAEALDVAGDRATGTFDYFGIVKEGNSYLWKLVGKSDS